jgi:hypothetical protein
MLHFDVFWDHRFVPPLKRRYPNHSLQTIWGHGAALPSRLHWFETEVLT